MTDVLNIAAYKFVALDELPALRQRLLDAASASALRGTILLAEEGINLFLAGDAAAVRDFVAAELRGDPRFADLEVKESWSAATPFRRLRVRIKREIIRMDRPAIRPAAGRAPAVDAATLARWLDAGRDDAGRELVMLDTRNGFEVDAGRFRGALDWRLSRFGEFPAALEAHAASLRGKTVVSYCTGGIRCEKAALLMREQGLEHVLQLDGGILRYFEQVGGRHFDGECFVFDQRVALDERLAPAG
ncbi:sulfurtransferase [Caldimonas sp. KR1-144]|uniref:sulfurtransferase n=1 Tax=Caldimonas sp. KR1-144 TaxID=3400911 RepID=UPI003BFC4698